MSRIGQKFLCAIAFVLAQLAVAASHADEVRYYATDALHSVTVVMDEKGNVVEKTYYAPYGEVLNRALRDAPGYGGHEEDAATGLVYMEQRYYDPVVGRFLSVDPIEAQGNGESFNRYDYALNNPYSFTDPDGRCAGSAATGMTAASCNELRDGDERGGALSPVASDALAASLPAGDAPERKNQFQTSSEASDNGKVRFYGRVAWLTGNTKNAMLVDRDRATIGGEVMTGAAAVGGTAIAVDVISTYVVVPATAAGKKVWNNLSFDGPNIGFSSYGNGRIAGVRWKGGAYGIRLDFHPLPESNGISVLHLNFGPAGRGEAGHLILDPHYWGHWGESNGSGG